MFSKWLWIVCLLFLSVFNALAQQKLTVAALEFPPFSSKKLPKYGPLVDLTRSVLAAANYQSEVVFMPWARALIWCQQGKIDAITGIWQTPERAQYGVFTRPIITDSTVFYRARGGNIRYSSISDLKNKNLLLGRVRGYALPKVVFELGLKEHQVASDEQNFRMLASGRVDLVTVDQDHARYILGQPELVDIVDKVEQIPGIVSNEFQHVFFCGNNQQSQQRAERFNQALIQLKQSKQITQ